jgi:hypothetical protein
MIRSLGTATLFAALSFAIAAAGEPTPPPRREGEPPRARSTAAPEWRRERLSFPLEFAPQIPFHGVEEITFAPGFFDPGAEDFWSYRFFWRLDGEPQLGQAELEKDLLVYFSGLSHAVGDRKYRFDASHFAARLHALGDAYEPGSFIGAFSGTVDTYDPFVTGRPVSLNLKVTVSRCPERRRIVSVTASPQPYAHPIWQALARKSQDEACHG